MEKFGAISGAELWNILQGKLRGRGASSCRLDRKLGKKKNVGNRTQTGSPEFCETAELLSYC